MKHKGPTIFKQAREKREQEKRSRAAAKSKPAVVSDRARRAIPKRGSSPPSPLVTDAELFAFADKLVDAFVGEYRAGRLSGGVVSLSVHDDRIRGFAHRFVANHREQLRYRLSAG